MIGAIRKRAFRATLAIEEKSMQQWAEENGVSYTHLHEVLTNKRSSRRMQNKLDLYITATLVPFCQTVLDAAAPQKHPTAA